MDSLADNFRTAGRWAWRNFRPLAGIALVAGIALRRLGATAPPVATLRIWARSYLLRCEPSGAVGFVYAGEMVAVAAAEALALTQERRAQRPAVAGPARAVPAAAPRTIVVVPTYDERESLPLLLERFAPTGMELLIVDDSSPDGTGDLADDLSHPPEKLAEMRAVLLERDAGLVLGSRYLPGGGTDGWSATRLALSRIGCSASRLALGLPFSDLSGGLKMWRADTLSAIELDELLSAGYAFQVETTQLATWPARASRRCRSSSPSAWRARRR